MMMERKKSFGDRVDSVVAIFNPQAGAARAQARNVMHVHEQFRMGAHSGAESNRLNADWITQTGDANADTLDDLPLLRERSRDLVMKDGRAQGIIKTLVTSVIGTGICPKPSLDHEILGIDEDQALSIERQLATVFKSWAPHADAGGRLSFYGKQALAYRNKKVNGEYVELPQFRARPGRRLQLCLHGIESDRLDTPDGDLLSSTIHGGVEVGKYGEPVRYHIRKVHPGDETNLSSVVEDFDTIDAEDGFGHKLVLHEFDVLRDGQTRGVPTFSAILNEFHDLAEYRESERYVMRMAACAGLIVNDNTGAANFGGALKTVNGQLVQSMEPGQIAYGSGDLTVTQVQPTHPGNNYEGFVREIERVFGVSQGMGWELASKMFSDSNYSSLRAAFVEARRYYRTEQEDFIHFYCQPVWDWLLWEIHLLGLVDMPGFMELREYWTTVDWVPQGWDWVDPEKEVKASVLAIERGLSTLERETAKTNSGDWKKNLTQRAAESRTMRENGLGDPEKDGALDERLSRMGYPLSKAEMGRRYGREESNEAKDTLVPTTGGEQRTGNPGRREGDQGNDTDDTDSEG